MSDLNNVQKFYKDKVIFITGGSGFMGKVLVEKLLYSCSDLKQIYILMRPKRGKSPEERVVEMADLPMFHRIKDEKPDVLKKIIPVFGDITSKNLGLSDDHLKKVLTESQIVFHMAATLKLEATLKPAVEMNLMGTEHVIDLAKQMPKLISILHLSTAFCNCDVEILMEKVYDWPHKPRDVISCAEWMDEKTMAVMGENLIAPQPNTYTYTKRLAEILVRDEFPNLPICIVRPSIVTAAFKEPLPGWVDSLNGPIGVTVAGAKGAIRSMLGNKDYKGEMIPVDMAINGLIGIAYVNGTLKDKPANVPVYNVTCNENTKDTWDYNISTGLELNKEYPFEAGIWYPNGGLTMNKVEHLLKVFFFMRLPAYIIDFLLFCFRQRRFVVRLQNRIAIGLSVLEFFTMNDWNFNSQKFQEVYAGLTSEEQEMFLMDTRRIPDKREYIKNMLLGGRVYCMKEPLSTLPKARMQMKIMWCLDKFFKTLFTILFIWIFLRLTGLNNLFPEALRI